MFRELEFNDQLRFMWGWCWRGFCITLPAALCAMILGAIMGGMLGVALAILHKDIHGAKSVLQVLGGAVGLIVGFAALFPLIGWLTRARFGRYELWIVRSRDE